MQSFKSQDVLPWVLHDASQGIVNPGSSLTFSIQSFCLFLIFLKFEPSFLRHDGLVHCPCGELNF